jgi:hypothetical protein
VDGDKFNWCIWMHEGGTMAGEYKYISFKGEDYFDDWEGDGKCATHLIGYYGNTHGCGCCSSEEGPLTLDDLKRHLASLLSEAKSTAEIINKMEVTNERA